MEGILMYLNSSIPGLRAVALAAVLVLAGGCSDADDIDGLVTRAWSPQQLAALPDSVSVAGRVLHIEGQANRDFMPIAPANGHPLSVGANLMSSAGDRPAWTATDPVLYVVHGDRMWIVDAQTWQPPATAALLWAFYADRGPKWTPGGVVDVVLEFDVAPGDRRRIIDRGVAISRSE